jgi:hypothetical protein
MTTYLIHAKMRKKKKKKKKKEQLPPLSHRITRLIPIIYIIPKVSHS